MAKQWSWRDHRPWELIPAVAITVVAGAFAWRALRDPSGRDFATYYLGADRAWRGVSPWRDPYWLQTPGTILAVGPFTAVFGQSAAAWWLTIVNFFLTLGLAAAALWYLVPRVARWFAWTLVVALTAWGPLAGTFWWKQFNLIALAMVVAGFALARRRPWIAGVLIGVSIAIKPLALLLPLFFLLRRETRRAGAAAVVAAAGWTLGGLLVVARAAGEPLDPFGYYRLFDDRTVEEFACNRVNTSPTGMACRLMGSTEHFGVIRVVVLLGLAVLVALAIARVLGTGATSMAVLAWACLLSPMVSPLEWPHYGVMMAPMFLYLAVVAWQHSRRLDLWFGIVVAYALSQVVWNPAQSAVAFFSGTSESLEDVYRTFAVSAAAQFVLVAVALAAPTRPTGAPLLGGGPVLAEAHVDDERHP